MSSTGSFSRVPAKAASEVAGRFPIGESARAELRDGMTPGEFLEVLVRKEEFPDAVRFLAYALPKREAVWWACLSAQSNAGSEGRDTDTAAIKAAEAWVTDPTEENRRAAGSAADATEYRTAAGCAAATAFWSGGSLGPPHVPVVPPGEQLTAHGASCAVILAAVSGPPEAIPERYRAALSVGVQVAHGERPWPQTAPPPAPTPEPTEAVKPQPAALRKTVRWE